jgi:hypothetical protein
MHERLHLRLNLYISQNIGTMGLLEQWNLDGASNLRAQNGDGSEGDSTGGPDPERSGPTAWPTLVIEAGYSESLEALRNDVRWWFSASNHQVKIVALAKFYHGSQRQRILLEKWIETQPLAHRVTRRPPEPRPILSQAITIISEPANQATGTLASYTVVGGPLRLEFHLLFLRAAGPGQGDIFVTVEQLQQYARHVWSAHIQTE